MAFGVTPQMIESFGDIIFELSLNVQIRTGDPVRALDFAEIERRREMTGLSDTQIGEKIGLATEQVRFIRVVMERRRFRTDQYRKLFTLGSGRRYREERYTDPAERYAFSGAAMELREAIKFDPTQVSMFVKTGSWRDETLGGWLRERAARGPEAPAIAGAGETVGYGELDGRVSRLAGALVELGIGKGDVVSVQLPNDVEFLVALLAAARVGAVFSTIHMPYRRAEVETLLRHSRARAVVCLSDRGDHPAAAAMVELRDRLPDLEQVIALGPAVSGASSFTDLVDSGVAREVPNPPVGSDPYLLLYTSGTSSRPKAVPLTHQNMLSNARLSAPEYAIGPADVVLSAAPFSHLFGLYSFHLALHAGACSALLPVYTPPDLAQAIEAGGATFLFAAPAHLGACLGAGLFDRHPPKSLRVTIVSGNAPPPELVPAFAAKSVNGRCIQLWGMTELQCGLFSRPHDPIEVAAHSAGRACPGNEVRIAGADGAPCPTGEEGELHVRGSSLFPGYFDNAEANRDAFTVDGWFRTGDLGKMDAAGNVSLTGRTKEVINRGGVKFNPRDVEEMIDEHPSVEQSAIVPMPDPLLGEKACCFVVLAPGAEVTLAELCAYLLGRDIAKQKLPERLEIIEEMPLTPTRKIIKGRLAERLR